MLSTAFAQYGQKDQRDQRDNGRGNDIYASNNNRGNDHYGKGYGTYAFTAKEKNMQIEQIYREYDYRIQSVKNKPFMNWFQKKRQINKLEEQRDTEIAGVNYKFSSSKNKFFENDHRDRKRW